MDNFKDKNWWALILGGSSGFGLASAKKLSSLGMNVCILHRDRRGAMPRIEQAFLEIRSKGVGFAAFNVDALNCSARQEVLDTLPGLLQDGKIRLLLHSIASGSVKLAAPLKPDYSSDAAQALAEKLGLEPGILKRALSELFQRGNPEFYSLLPPPPYESGLLLDEEDLAHTIYAMGTSLLSWTRAIFERGLFAEDARVIGLTSEGNEVAWRGYAAVSAAKAALEAVSRSIAREYAVHGIRANIVQPGVTDTPALRLIPGSDRLAAQARLKNPFGRLTKVEDVADVIALLCTDEAAWINGSIIRVDGGECISA